MQRSETLNFISDQLVYSLMRDQMNIPSLFKTIDGGFIWTEIDLPGQEGELQDVYFYDNKEGVVVIRDLMNMVNPSMIFKTLDDGETWEDISPESTAVGIGNAECQFIDVNSGFFATDKFLYSTLDGGVSWSTQEFDNYIIAMDFLDNDHGILGTWNGTFEYIGGTLVTSDGGTTWNTYSLAEKNTDIFRVQQLSSTTSILATFVGPNSELGQLMKSSDNGISWEEVSIPMNDNNEDQRLISVDFVDGSSGVICSSNSGTAEVYGTSDGGQTWTLEALNLPTFISDVQLTENSGYIGGIVGTLYKRDLTNAIVYFPISIETRIYPTIAKSQDLISWTSAENFTKIVIMNESGCLISKYELDTNLISLPKLTSGVYFIHLSNDLYFSTSKIVVAN